MAEHARSLSERFVARLLATDEPVAAPQQPRDGESLVADVIRDLLRSMIQRWLDENLQSLAERIVRAEVAEAMRASGNADPSSFAETVVWLVRRKDR